MSAACDDRDELQLLLCASYRFSDTRTTEDAADVLAEVACQLTGADGAHVFVPRLLGSAALTNANVERTTAERHSLQIDPEDWVVGLRQRLADGQSCFLADAVTSPSVHQGLRARFGTSSLLYLPLLDVGVLVLLWRSPQRQSPDVASLEPFVLMAAQILRRRLEAAMLRDESVTDPLTSLGNRRALFQAIAPLGGDGSVVLVDLDSPASPEDAHRHPDAALQRFADTLRSVCPDGGAAMRYGGEEFAIVLASGGLLEAQDVVVRLHEACFDAGPDFSVGIAVHRPGATPEETMEAADRALFVAKRSDAQRVAVAPAVVWDEPAPSPPGTRAVRRIPRSDPRLSLALLDEALNLGMVEPHYQPVLSTAGGVHSTEVLARLRHPRTALLLEPAQFLPLAERTGRVVRLDALVAERALYDLSVWRGQDPGRPLGLAVNVSVSDLDDPGLVTRLLTTCERHHLGVDGLTVEITETMQSLRGRGHEQVLRELADAGAQIVLDDFGTGFAALSYLLRFPVHGIKIDRSFTAALGDAHGRRVMAGIIQLGLGLGLSVVAEGVETAEQLTQLTDLGCPLVQGFHLGRPVPAAHVPELLARLDPERSLVG